MKIRFPFVLITLLPLQLLLAGDSIGLEQELFRLKTDTAMVVHSQAVDEYPLWSADGTILFFNVSDHWKKIDLGVLHLDDAVWRGDQTIAVIDNCIKNGI